MRRSRLDYLAVAVAIFGVGVLAAPTPAASGTWSHATASAYSTSDSPGIEGCTGRRLSDSTRTFASLIVPCGARVKFCIGHRCVVATRTDSGPYVSGRSFDLALGTARALGFSSPRAFGVTDFPDRDMSDFEPPAGSILIEDFLNARWGDKAPRTYNKGLTVLRDFFRWHVDRGTLLRDPMRTIERATPRAIHRTTFSDEQRERILGANPDPRDQVALRLLLDYGLRKGALQNVQFKHFDGEMRRLTIFTKGEKIFTLPIVDEYVWRCLLLLHAPAEHFLLPRQKQRRRRPPNRKQFNHAIGLLEEFAATIAAVDDAACAREQAQLASLLGVTADWLDLTIAAASVQVRRWPDEKIGDHGAHHWWYRCLARAGIVEPGVAHGQRMHKARHTAGQRVLDATGNLKAAQSLLCHATIGTTGDSYVGWEIEQLAASMRATIPPAAEAPSLAQALHERAREAGARV